MRIIISPAKKMNVDNDSFLVINEPTFINEAEQIKNHLQGMSPIELQSLWKCNDNIAKLNVSRLHKMDLHNNLTPALYSYEGIQYKCMAPNVFEHEQLEYIKRYLRILSGFYGILRPFDGVTPYRLEMQSKLQINNHKNLYSFWGNKIADKIAKECDVVINLASKEYSDAIKPHLPVDYKFITCTFGELKDGKIIEKGTMCKMARGYMVRYMAENSITDVKKIKLFSEQNYCYSDEHSTKDNYVFIR